MSLDDTQRVWDVFVGFCVLVGLALLLGFVIAWLYTHWKDWRKP